MSNGHSTTNGKWTRDTLIAYVQATTGQSNLITTPRLFFKMCDNDVVAALVLGQVIYWQDKGSGPHAEEGWFHKKAEEWEEEIGVSDYQLAQRLKKLAALGVETKVMKSGKAPTRHFRIDWGVFLKAVADFLETRNSRNSEFDFLETRNSINTYYSTLEHPTKVGEAEPQETDHYTPGEFVADLAIALKDSDVPLMKGKKGTYGKDLKKLQEARPDIEPRTWRLVKDHIVKRWLDDAHFKLAVEDALGDVVSGKANGNKRGSSEASNVIPIDKGEASAARRSKDFEEVLEAEPECDDEKTRAYLKEAYERGGVEELEQYKALVVKMGTEEEDVDAMADEILMSDEERMGASE